MLAPIHPGSDIDGFIVGEPVHSGAMGNIFRVTKSGSSTPMIMKVPRVGPDEPVEGIIAFETEATILPALSGPHVPRCVAVGDLARSPYLVTEWVEGESLDAVMHARRLAPDEVARVGAAIADALHSLHEQKTIHFDLKPANVILTPEGNAVLIDFGFAHHERFPDLLAEETRHAAGSAPYISPEQVLGTREDPRSDLFSLGVMLYEMATGRFPFGEPDTDVRNRLWFDPIPPRAHDAQLEPWLQEIILRAIEPRAELRYQSASHLAFDLRHPAQVRLTARATRLTRATLTGQVRRFLHAYGEYGGRRKPMRSAHLSRFPIVMVAVDTSHPDDERQPAIRQATRQILALDTEFRLVFVSVIETSLLADGSRPESASGAHYEHLVRLRHWVDPLRIPAQRLSLHVLPSPNAAEALLDFARANHVDLIVLGAPAPSQPGRSWWRSVASTVTANAPCSVHVVRVPERPSLVPRNRTDVRE
jgi:serine/threonine protein kinase